MVDTSSMDINKRIRFLHIVKDDKFLASTILSFEQQDVIDSTYIYFRKKGRKLHFIKPEDNIEIYDSVKDFRNRLVSGDYDVVYLHSLQFGIMRFLRSIPKDKILIWWAWGYDIYGQQVLGMKSFINIEVFKPETNRLWHHFDLKRFFARLWMEPFFAMHKREVLSRVDYFQPVCDVDYDLMKEQTGFRAKKIYLVGPYIESQVHNVDPDGCVLIGNAAAPMENHLDVWMSVKDYIPRERKVIVPLSYGDVDYANKVKKGMLQTDHNICFLDSFLPKEEYFSLFNSCSYAVYGTLRQHAMGNIYRALRKGIKVFLYKDSVLYRHFIKHGYIVFPIEEMDSTSFSEPLSLADRQRNLEAIKAERLSYREIGREALLEIQHQL